MAKGVKMVFLYHFCHYRRGPILFMERDPWAPQVVINIIYVVKPCRTVGYPPFGGIEGLELAPMVQKTVHIIGNNSSVAATGHGAFQHCPKGIIIKAEGIGNTTIDYSGTAYQPQIIVADTGNPLVVILGKVTGYRVIGILRGYLGGR